MKIDEALQRLETFGNLQLVANQVVEGFISGIHKSPFRGFSSEFAEHKSFNTGDSTRHIDWKHFAKTDRLYVKTYEEETNLRCHIIIDNSASMHYPKVTKQTATSYNKLGFSVLAAAALMNLLKRQRDAIGLSVYSDAYEFYAPEKGSDRHHRMLVAQLEGLLHSAEPKTTQTSQILHEIAEKLKRRSLVLLFTDMFEASQETEKLFESLRHLRYNKHRVVLFHVIDKQKEYAFDFDNAPRRFVDVETGDKLDLYADSVQTEYKQAVASYFQELKLQCAKYRISYVAADINDSMHHILMTYLTERGGF
jgi:uncharacterized protein (DUF58 family)